MIAWPPVIGAAAALVGLAAVRSGRLLSRTEAAAWVLASVGLLLALSPTLAAVTGLFTLGGLCILVWLGQTPRKATEAAGPATAESTPTTDILVVMPALNEAENLALHLPKAPRTVLGHEVSVLVVDDGSTDNTAVVAADLGARVARSEVNHGGGHALRVGFAAARRLAAHYVVTLDADGQHRFEDLPVVLAPLLSGAAEIVVGSRRLGHSEGHSAIRSLGVDVFNALLGFLLGRRVTDCASGFRGLRVDGLARLSLTEDRHHTAELLLLASAAGLRVVEVPITIVPRTFGETRKGTTIRYACRFAMSVARGWWRATSESTGAA